MLLSVVNEKLSRLQFCALQVVSVPTLASRSGAGWLARTCRRDGRVSVRGVFPRAYSFDTVGPITHTVADAAALLQAIANTTRTTNTRFAPRQRTSPPN